MFATRRPQTTNLRSNNLPLPPHKPVCRMTKSFVQTQKDTGCGNSAGSRCPTAAMAESLRRIFPAMPCNSQFFTHTQADNGVMHNSARQGGHVAMASVHNLE
jgi:hypothetical protein